MIVPLRKIAIIEDLSTDNVVRLSNINSGVDGASEFGYSISENESSIRDNQPNLISNTHQLDIRTLEDDGSQEHLDNWTRDNTEVYISGITLDGFFLWGDRETTTGATRLYKNYQYDSRRSNKIFTRSDELPGFDENTGIYNGGVWAGDNGLGMYEWDDADGGGVADGWQASGTANETFTNGVQSIEAGTGVDSFRREIYFPFAGEQLTFSITIDSLTGTYSRNDINIREYNASGSSINTNTTNISSTGTKSVTLTTSSNCVSVECFYAFSADSTTVTTELSDPMLSRVGSTTYTKF